MGSGRRSVLILRLKSCVVSVLKSRLSCWLVGVVFGDTVPFRGTRIRTRAKGSIESPLLLAGIYERAEIDFVHRHLPVDQAVVELGASLGGNTCQIARRVLPTTAMVSVEANPEIVGILRENISRNCGARTVDVVHAMIGDRVGEGSLEIGESTLESSAGTSGGRTVVVPMVTLAEVAARLGERPFSLVSDVEGAEIAIFTEQRSALVHCNLMIIECHSGAFGGRHYSLEEVVALPLADGAWEMIDRHHAVAVYRRKRS
jgi:FkbM family methyltransferase